MPLDDIDRIEVIRGPGASVWGANAVNGVISIITKRAEQTSGGLISAGGGTGEQGFGTARWGGSLGSKLDYRISSRYSNRSHLPDPSGQNGHDAWNVLQTALRADSKLTTRDAVTVEIGGFRGGEDERVPTVTSVSPAMNQVLSLRETFSGWSVLSQWEHAFSPRSDTSLRAYFDRNNRSDPTFGLGLNTFDIDFRHHLELWGRHSIVWGAGFRNISADTTATLRVSFTPPDPTDQIFNAFVQDEIALLPDKLYLTAGAKLEHNSFTRFNFQPTLRLAWVLDEGSMVWASVLEAARTPSIADISVRFTQQALPGPGLSTLVIAFGNPQQKNEELLAIEAGWRTELAKTVSLDVTAFYNRYRRLRSVEPATPFLETVPPPPHVVAPVIFGNQLYGETHGAEAAVDWRVSSRWKIRAGYAFLAMHMHQSASSGDTLTARGTEGNSPAHQAQLRSHIALTARLAFDVSGYFVSRLSFQHVPSYTRLDTGLTWQAGEHSSVGIYGQNLLSDHHLETTNTDQIVQSNWIKRSGYARFTWQF